MPRQPIYDGAYPEMLSTASQGNPAGVTKLSSLLLFAQPEKKFFEESTKSGGKILLTIFGKNSETKVPLQSKLASKLDAVHIASTVLQFK